MTFLCKLGTEIWICFRPILNLFVKGNYYHIQILKNAHKITEVKIIIWFLWIWSSWWVFSNGK